MIRAARCCISLLKPSGRLILPPHISMKVVRLDLNAQLKTPGTPALPTSAEWTLEQQPHVAAKVQESYA